MRVLNCRVDPMRHMRLRWSLHHITTGYSCRCRSGDFNGHTENAFRAGIYTSLDLNVGVLGSADRGFLLPLEGVQDFAHLGEPLLALAGADGVVTAQGNTSRRMGIAAEARYFIP